MVGVTERKPPGVNFETWIDRQIREAAERGEFDNLPGAGKPLPTPAGGADDELWWVKGLLHREGLSAELLLPTSLQLRRQVERLPETVHDLPSEQAVREVVGELNRRIVHWLRAPDGPWAPIAPVNADEVVRQWRAAGERARAERAAAIAEAAPQADSPARPRWWHRFTRRPRR
jgi:hypothetical protein